MKIKLKQTYSFIIKIFIFCLFLFARTFTGLTIFGYRLGEYIIGGTLLLVVIYSILIPIFKKKYILDSKSVNVSVVLLISSFVIRIILSDVTFSDIFIFKTSLYIWSLGALVVGYYLLNDKVLSFTITICI
jgi:hypothetical protein